MGKFNPVASEFELIQYSTHLRWSSEMVQRAARFCGEEVRMRVEVADDLVQELDWEACERHADFIR